MGLLSFGKLQTTLFSAISLSELCIPGQFPSPAAHSSLSWLGVCFMGDCLIKSSNVHIELSGTQFRTGRRVAFVIHFPYSLMRIMASVSLHCSSKAWYSSGHTGREEEGWWAGQWVGGFRQLRLECPHFSSLVRSLLEQGPRAGSRKSLDLGAKPQLGMPASLTSSV